MINTIIRIPEFTELKDEIPKYGQDSRRQNLGGIFLNQPKPNLDKAT